MSDIPEPCPRCDSAWHPSLHGFECGAYKTVAGLSRTETCYQRELAALQLTVERLESSLGGLYCHITRGLLSKPYVFEEIQAAIDDAIARICQDEIADLKNARRCAWKYNEGHDYYATDCSRAFQITTDTPKENGYHFCPGCGGEITEERICPACDGTGCPAERSRTGVVCGALMCPRCSGTGKTSTTTNP